MRKAIIVGVSLVIMGWAAQASAQQVQAAAQAQPAAQSSGLTDAHIVYIRDALRLTPAQAQYWPAVEAALRDLVQREHAFRRGGLIQKLSIATEVKRLIAIANPLIKTLSEAQRREGMRVAQAMGVTRMVAAAF